METNKQQSFLESILPLDSKVFTVQIKRTPGGKRLIKLLAIDGSEIRDISMTVGRLLGLKVDDIIGAVWTTDADMLVESLSEKLLTHRKFLRHQGL